MLLFSAQAIYYDSGKVQDIGNIVNIAVCRANYWIRTLDGWHGDAQNWYRIRETMFASCTNLN